MSTHRILAFTDAAHEDAFTRGYEDGRMGRAAPDGETQAAAFAIGEKRGTLRFTLLPPLAEARWRGWQAAQGGPRTADDVAGAARAGVRLWRDQPHLAFAVETAEEPDFTDEERALWEGRTYALVAQGVAPTAAEDAGEGLIGFAVAEALSPSDTSVTLTVTLGNEQRVLVFALP